MSKSKKKPKGPGRPTSPDVTPGERESVLDGRRITLEEGVGRVRMVDGAAHVCELGVQLRLGLGRVPDRDSAAALFPLFDLCPGEERPAPGTMLADRPVFAWISQHDAAVLLRLTTRQVQNLETKGLPNFGRGKTKRYALPHLLIWFRAYNAQGKPQALPFRVAEAYNLFVQAEDEYRALVEG